MKIVDNKGDEKMADVQDEKEEEVVDDKHATEQDLLIVQLIYIWVKILDSQILRELHQ